MIVSSTLDSLHEHIIEHFIVCGSVEMYNKLSLFIHNPFMLFILPEMSITIIL